MKLKASIESEMGRAYKGYGEAKREGNKERMIYYKGLFDALYWTTEKRDNPCLIVPKDGNDWENNKKYIFN